MLLSAANVIGREMAPEPDISARRSAPYRAAYPVPATAPQFTLWPQTPSRSRQLAIESSHALAAECEACPDEPSRPAIDEKTLKTPNAMCHRLACSTTAPYTLGPYLWYVWAASWHVWALVGGIVACVGGVGGVVACMGGVVACVGGIMACVPYVF